MHFPESVSKIIQLPCSAAAYIMIRKDLFKLYMLVTLLTGIRTTCSKSAALLGIDRRYKLSLKDDPFLFMMYIC